MHIDNQEKYLKDSREREKASREDKEDVVKQLEEIDRKARLAMGESVETPSLASGASSGSYYSPDAPEKRAAEKRSIEQVVEDAKRRHQHGGRAMMPADVPTPSACLWTRHTDPNSGTSYYYNVTSGESRWEAPPDFTEAAASTQVGAWVVSIDPGSGCTYYHNPDTGTSTWERPAELDAAVDVSNAPPPPPKRQPPPPPPKPKDTSIGAAGRWEEVKPQDSMFARAEEVSRAMEPDSDDETPSNPVLQLKYEMAYRRFADEDVERREKEVFSEKKSLQAKPAAGGTTFRKAVTGSGIRKRKLDDD